MLVVWGLAESVVDGDGCLCLERLACCCSEASNSSSSSSRPELAERLEARLIPTNAARLSIMQAMSLL